MTGDKCEFHTSSSPGEQAFENEAKDATARIAELFESDYYGPEMERRLRDAVRSALAADGVVTPQRAARELSAQGSQDVGGGPVLQRLEDGIGETDSSTRDSGGGSL
jgi:hypothetical protein